MWFPWVLPNEKKGRGLQMTKKRGEGEDRHVSDVN